MYLINKYWIHFYPIGAAQIIEKSAANVTRLVEKNVTLVCTVIGDPNPVITWLKRSENGDVRQIKSTTDKYDSNLTIIHATIEHSGIYVCMLQTCLVTNPMRYGSPSNQEWNLSDDKWSKSALTRTILGQYLPKTVGCMEITFLKIDAILNPNIRYTFVVMAHLSSL